MSIRTSIPMTVWTALCEPCRTGKRKSMPMTWWATAWRRNLHRERLKQEFSADSPNWKWCTDFTYLFLKNRDVRYNCTIIDLYDRSEDAIITDQRITSDLAICSLGKALESQPQGKDGLRLHSDQGEPAYLKGICGVLWSRSRNPEHELGRLSLWQCVNGAVFQHAEEWMHEPVWVPDSGGIIKDGVVTNFPCFTVINTLVRKENAGIKWCRYVFELLHRKYLV